MTAITLVFLAVWQSGLYNSVAQTEVDSLIDANLDSIARGVYNLVQTEDEAVQQQVDMNLKVARSVLMNHGGVTFSDPPVVWDAKNQYTGESERLRLPGMYVGGRWLGQNRNPDTTTPVVDEVRDLVGDTVTIFQRMNSAGDMLRVATNVTNGSGERAIGTYIPAVNPDGRANPVVDAILAGNHYHGRAYVVNSWYLTAYRPLYSEAGDIVGMLYVGVRQREVEERIRQAILQTTVGKTGYVYVIGGKGEDRGHYIISHKGERDGEDIWDVRGRDGRYVIRDIIATATGLAPGEMATIRYLWQNPGEESPRWKVARLVYYEPWDWVIGAGVYEEELQSYRAVLQKGRRRMTYSMALAGVVITILAGLFGFLSARRIARPVEKIRLAAEAITRGSFDIHVTGSSRDEIGELVRVFNYMTDRLKETLGGLQQARDDLYQALGEVELSLHEKEALLREVHHRVRNNLQLIISMIHIQGSGGNTAAQENILKEMENRVRSMAMVHDVLYQSEYASEVDFTAYVRNIGNYLLNTYNNRDKRIDMEYDLADITLDIAQAIPCGLVLNELITNSLRHGFPGGKQGRIRLELHTLSGGDVQLRTSDNGVGLPEGFDPATGRTIGFMLVESLIQQLDGRLDITSDGGLDVTVSFTPY